MTRREERGSASLEAVIGLPAFAIFVALIIMGGRTATAPNWRAAEIPGASIPCSAAATRAPSGAAAIATVRAW